MPAYTDEQKEVIAKNYLFNRVVQSSGLNIKDVIIEDEVWPLLIRPLGFDTGIRSLRRNIETIVRKVAKEKVEGKSEITTISETNLKQYLPDFIKN